MLECTLIQQKCIMKKKNRPLEFSIGGGDTGATEVVVMTERVLNIKFLKLSYNCRK